VDFALQQYAAALDKDDHFAAAHFSRGLLFEKLGRFDRAALEFLIMKDMHLGGPEVHQQLGHAFWKQQRWAEAIEGFRGLGWRWKSRANAFELGTSFYELRNFAEAEEQFRRLTKEFPDVDSGYVLVGKCYISRSEWDRSIAFHEGVIAIARFRNSVDALASLALSYAARGESRRGSLEDYARALDLTDRILAIDDKDDFARKVRYLVCKTLKLYPDKAKGRCDN
jgi:tetratricopeptide (TPR) repeat protein